METIIAIGGVLVTALIGLPSLYFARVAARASLASAKSSEDGARASQTALEQSAELLRLAEAVERPTVVFEAESRSDGFSRLVIDVLWAPDNRPAWIFTKVEISPPAVALLRRSENGEPKGEATSSLVANQPARPGARQFAVFLEWVARDRGPAIVAISCRRHDGEAARFEYEVQPFAYPRP